MTSPPTDPPPPEFGPDGAEVSTPVDSPSAGSADAGADHADQPPPPPVPIGRIVAVALAGIVVLIGALYAIGYALAGDKVPKNATVEGVPVGGLSSPAAAATLEKALESRATSPLPLTVAGESASLDPATAGLTIDYVASIEAAGGGRSPDPRHIYRVLVGGSETSAVVDVDAARLSTAVEELARGVDREPADARLSYDGRKIVTEDGVQGVTVDSDEAAEAIVAAYPSEVPVVIPATTAEPEITTADVQTLVREFAQPAVAAPVVVDTGRSGSFEVSPTMIASAITFVPANGTLAPRLDAGKLRKAVDGRIDNLDLVDHRDATVRLVDGKPKVIPAADGTDIAAKALGAAVEPVLTRPEGERSVAVKLTGAPATFTTKDAAKLGIEEVTGEFTTYFPNAHYRNVNLARAAQKINNTVLKPGETFSLNKIVGERTKANGFVEGYIIQGGKFKKELGGGVSQSATTTFNAMFFAGLQDVQHQPHTLYIDRYPAGREATVAWPSLDLKFRNNTDYGVLIQAYVKKGTPNRKGSITVKMWSTKTWDKVASSALVRSGYTTGRDRTDDSSDCEPQAPVQGFTVNYSRLFYRNGEVAKREPFRWRYAPTDRIRCT